MNSESFRFSQRFFAGRVGNFYEKRKEEVQIDDERCIWEDQPHGKEAKDVLRQRRRCLRCVLGRARASYREPK